MQFVCNKFMNIIIGLWLSYECMRSYCLCVLCQVKVNNNSHIGLGCTHTLKPGIKVTLASLIDAKNLNQGGHKLGFGLDFEA